MGQALANKTALVTGGVRGIGASITRTLAEAGAQVIACYHTPGEHVEVLAKELAALGGDHHLVLADVTDPDQVVALAQTCRERYGRLDVVVNNAGAISHVPFAELPLAEWHRVIDTGLTAAFHVTQQVLPLLDRGASVINIGSRVATVGIPLRAHYTAAKAGLIGLTRSLAKELGPQGIRVNVVAPGVTATEVELPAEVTARYEGMTALRRLGSTDDIAAVVAFLAADGAAYVTGETIHVDGGI
ncbi:SDR family oxidoreductase [Nocardia brasiliensis]|uniref:3-oxoacyl-[acyl-carrier-protein] reductase MabA n=1 Tax=Nocardia brasiliensis TaxID=37326 RepID=A0A6G9XQP8_NOCBR|nr:3-oxoacyl-ACP reductase family protein [Nocardia brasiliensis]QIS03272.1 SDR family oxidoreductase [Nocardia brasiliensis]